LFGEGGYCQGAKDQLGKFGVGHYCESVRTFFEEQQEFDFDIPLGEKKIVLAKPEIEGFRIELPSGSSFNEVASLLKSRTTQSAYAVTYSDIYGLRCDDYWSNVEKILKTQSDSDQKEGNQQRIKCIEELKDEINDRRLKIDSSANERKSDRCLDISPPIRALFEFDLKSKAEENISKELKAEVPDFTMEQIKELRTQYTKAKNKKTFFTTNEKKEGKIEIEGETEIPYKLATEEKMRNLISCLQLEDDMNLITNKSNLEERVILENLEHPLNSKIGKTADFVNDATKKVNELQEILKKNRQILKKLWDGNSQLLDTSNLGSIHV